MAAPISWPHGARCAVALTFDLDFEAMYLNWDLANEKRPVLLSMGTYGANRAMPEILALLAERGVKGTCFIPGWVIEHHPQTVQAILAGGHEIGAHGYLHEYIGDFSPEEEESILARSVEIIQAATGQPPAGYRSPAWELSPNTLSLLDRYSFSYSSNFMDDIYPYFHHRPDGSASLVELPVYWDIDDAPFLLFSRGRQWPLGSPDLLEGIWRRELEAYHRRGGLFVLTIHPQLQRPAHLDMLGRFVEYAQSLPGVWLATGQEISQHLRSVVR